MADELGPLRIVRPEDLLNLAVRLTNLRVSPDRRVLERIDAGAPALLTFVLPPQHLSERAFFEFEDRLEPAGEPPVAYVAAAPSRLVFALPDDAPEWPLDVEHLLDWGRMTARLAGNALPPDAPGGPELVPPAEDETAVEVPYGLQVSPDQRARWVHRFGAFSAPFSALERFEVWHSVLRPDDEPEDPVTRARPVSVRAVGFRDIANSFTASLSTRDLEDLVTLSGDFGNGPKTPAELGLSLSEWVARLTAAGVLPNPYVPVPLRADHFAVGPLGAHVRMRGLFDFPRGDQDPALLLALGVKTPGLTQYEHVVGSGRDQWVKVVRRGYLDSGHRACLVKVTHRTFEPILAGDGVGPQGHFSIYGTRAYLRQYYQVVVQEPVLDYGPLAAAYPHGGREMPIRSLRIRTLSTPKLDLPSADPDDPGAPALDPDEIERVQRVLWRVRHPWWPPPDEATIGRLVQDQIEQSLAKPFWLSAGGQKVLFDVVAMDWEGREATTSKAMLFIPYEFTRSVTSGSEVAKRYNKDLAARTVDLTAQPVTVADPFGGVPGSTVVPLETLTFVLAPFTSRVGLPQDYLPRWVLSVESLTAHLEAVERLTNTTEAVPVTLHPDYLKNGIGMGKNPAGTYLQLTKPSKIAFDGSRGGGLAQPRAELDVLTSRQGALPAQLASGAVPVASLKTIFGGAKLFGTVDLWRILGDIPAPGPGSVGLADLSESEFAAILNDPTRTVPTPVLRTRRILGPDGSPRAIEARFVWKPVLRTDPTLTPLIDVTGARFVLDARTVTPLDGGAPEATVRGELVGFALSFGGVVRVSMGRLVFLSLPGRKPDVTADGVSIDFLGPLEFVNTIRDVLPDDGFSDPPAITVTPEGITAGYSLGIPSVGVGVFSLQNLAISAMLSLPFVGKPAGLRFALSERQHPFLVTVTMFGGGGFFALGVSANGVDEIEASIEFGGNVSLNLGVASGGVYVMAGVYFGKTAQACVLTGYLRCGGYLSVLGLISISLEFYLAFTWRQKAGGGSEIWGQASLSVSVKVCCFSKSVKLSVERRFAGASGDPTLDQVLTAVDWQTYCLAFAPEVAA